MGQIQVAYYTCNWSPQKEEREGVAEKYLKK